MTIKDNINILYQIFTNKNYFRTEIVWGNVIGFLILHLGAFYGLFLMITGQLMTKTFIWTLIIGYFGSECITIGSHRLWTHKSFKSKPLLKLILALGQTIAGQNSIWVWARDHRQHHKYSDTDADPHSAGRGFFFCHMGWLLLRKLPIVITNGKTIDMSDLDADPIVMFQKKYYYPLYFIFSVVFPILIPVYAWGESWNIAIFVCYFFRWIIFLHGTWCVNSVAHLYGTRPYSKNIQPVESHFVAFISLGEGWHNFHHTFPWDYRAGEYGKYYNMTSTFIDWLEALGLAYNLKSVTNEMLVNRINKKGDGTHPLFTVDKVAEDVEIEKEDLFGEKLAKFMKG